MHNIRAHWYCNIYIYRTMIVRWHHFISVDIVILSGMLTLMTRSDPAVIRTLRCKSKSIETTWCLTSWNVANGTRLKTQGTWQKCVIMYGIVIVTTPERLKWQQSYEHPASSVRTRQAWWCYSSDRRFWRHTRSRTRAMSTGCRCTCDTPTFRTCDSDADNTTQNS